MTGYEPDLVKELTFDETDMRLLPFQVLSNENRIMIGVGVPFKRKKGNTISMAIFQPGKETLLYDKKYLHADELPYFVPGENLKAKHIGDGKTALAICYELSIPEHARNSLSENIENSLGKSKKNIIF